MNSQILKRTLCVVLPTALLLFSLVSCSSSNGSKKPPTVTTYTIGGTVSGLSGTLVLQNNGRNNLTRTANGSFAFSTALTNGAAYSVTVSSQPLGQTCTVTNGSGTINAANVTGVQVACAHNVLTGYFMDSPVGDLEYSTATQSGYTDSNGAFQYISGEVVSFYVGNILMGQASGAPKITPFDLAGISPPQTNLGIVRTMNEVGRSHHATRFEIAANIAVFLQTLDEDGVYSNGIRIPLRMHSLASGAEIDFTQKMSDFPNDFKFRQLVASGRSAGLWGGTRAIRKAGYALNTLYEGLGITADIHVNMRREYEYDAGAENTVDERHTYTYDANGNQTMEEIDSDANGTVDYRGTHTYDANGNMTMEESIYIAPGGPQNNRRTYRYDANGNQTMEEIDSGADDTVDERYIYTYDANGNRTIEEDDWYADGHVDYRKTYTYDANGNMTMEAYSYYGALEGYVDYRNTYRYDANGNQTMEEIDSGADGTVDERYLYAYDANGNQTIKEQDWHADGTVDDRTTYTYDANGNMTMHEVDWSADGHVDYRRTYTYDANGNMTREEVNYDADVIVEERYLYAYDANGNQTIKELDRYADGSVDERYTYTYDANGNQAMEEYDAGAQGYVNLRVNYLYQTGGGFMYRSNKQ
jgi:hypothetical protein